MKKVLSFLMVVVLVCSSLCVSVFAADAISIEIDGANKVFDVMPQIIDGRTMVPMRGIFEEFGATIIWDDPTKTVTGINGATTVVLTINESKAKLNGREVTLDVPAQIIDGRTMVPVRFIAEAMGCDVSWNDTTKTVIINRKLVKIEKGVVDGRVYENKSIGLGYNLPANWKYLSDEEIMEIYNVSKAFIIDSNYNDYINSLGKIHDMVAVGEEGANVQIVIQDMSSLGGAVYNIDPQAFSKEMVESLKVQFAQNPAIKNQRIDAISRKIERQTLYGIETVNDVNGTSMYQMQLYKFVGTYMIVVAVTAPKNDLANKYLNYFYNV